MTNIRFEINTDYLVLKQYKEEILNHLKSLFDIKIKSQWYGYSFNQVCVELSTTANPYEIKRECMKLEIDKINKRIGDIDIFIFPDDYPITYTKISRLDGFFISWRIRNYFSQLVSNIFHG